MYCKRAQENSNHIQEQTSSPYISEAIREYDRNTALMRKNRIFYRNLDFLWNSRNTGEIKGDKTRIP